MRPVRARPAAAVSARVPGARGRATLVARGAVACRSLACCRPLGGRPAADGLTMEAQVLLDGHTRIGSWMAIEVHLRNDGPAITGELRLAGGAQGETRFGDAGRPADPARTRRYRLYAQPPAFGREIDGRPGQDGATTVATTKAAFDVHDPTQLVVGIVAERPGDIVGGLHLLPNQNNIAPLPSALEPADLPERVEAWSTLDRLVWQDVDAARSASRAARRPARLGRRRRPARHRRRHRRAVEPDRLPRRPPALPPDRHDRRRPGLARRPARRGPGRRDRPAGAGRRARPTAGRSRRSATASSPPSALRQRRA